MLHSCTETARLSLVPAKPTDFLPFPHALAYAMFYTVSNTLLFETVGSEKPGRKLGLYSSVVVIAYFIGSLVAGYMAYYVGYSFAFIASGLLIFLSLFIFLGIYKQKN